MNIRKSTMKKLKSKLGVNIEILNIYKSEKKYADYRVLLKDNITGIVDHRNLHHLINRKTILNSLTELYQENNTAECNNSNIDDMKISDILNIGNKNSKSVKTKIIKTVDETLNIRLDKETKKLLEEKSNGNVSEFCRNIIKDSLTDKHQNKIISNNNDEKYEVLTNMIKELAEKISNLSVNVSFSK